MKIINNCNLIPPFPGDSIGYVAFGHGFPIFTEELVYFFFFASGIPPFWSGNTKGPFATD